MPSTEDPAKLDLTSPPALTTGFDLNLLITGLLPGQLTVIAARPGMGRTTLLTGMCWANAFSGVPTSVFTLEERHEDFMNRLVASHCRVPLTELRADKLSPDDWQRVESRAPRINEAPLTIHDPAAMTAAELADQVREDVAKHGTRLVAVDGIHDLRPEKYNDLREREVGDNARALKTLARELGISVITTAHLNRKADLRPDRSPVLDDVRESEAITYAADHVILIHHEDTTAMRLDVELIVAKNRYGPKGSVRVAAQFTYGRFINFE